MGRLLMSFQGGEAAMSKAFRVALPVLMAGVLCVAMASTSALAVCDSSVVILQGGSGGGFDPISCGDDPYRYFWHFAHGNPTVGLGNDAGQNLPGASSFEFLGPGQGNA